MTRCLARLVPAALAALLFVLTAADHVWASGAPTAVRKAGAVNTLPGVEDRSLLTAFSRQGYMCQEVSPPRPGWTSFYCESVRGGVGVPTQTVGFQGPGSKIAYVEASAYGTNTEVTTAFLDAVIDLAIDQQGLSAQARQWAHASINQPEAQTQVGAVHMAMFESPDPYPTPCQRLVVTPS